MAQQLSISNPTPRRLSGPQLLHHLVPQYTDDETSALENCTEDGQVSSLTFPQLHSHANRLAHRLLRAIHPTQSSKRRIFPIFIQQHTHLYVAQLASLKSGAAFCPIALDVPADRLRFILDDVDAPLLLTTKALKSQLPNLGNVRIIVVDDDDDHHHHHHQVEDVSSEPDVHIDPRDAAYVMYTSGSTGQPKGVVLSHASATQALLAHDRHIPEFSRFLQFASPTFDVSVFEIFFPWFRKRTLVSCDRRRLLNDLPAVIEQLQIDAAELTPSVAGNLLRSRKSVPSLKVLLTIGEMLKPAVVQEFGGSSHDSALLHGMYGPTEATIHCTLQTHFQKDMSCGSIGVPLDTVSAFVVNIPPEGANAPVEPEILPLGEEGELAVGGYQLADGYLNRDEQTRAAFVQHPKYGRLYRTGDRAKMISNGTFECLGRISTGQIKLRGQRMELGEIEYAASRTPSCQSSVAEVISGILVVFCVGQDSSLTTDSIRNTCQKWLPSFMVPGDIVILQSLPYLSSGKLDRKSLSKIYAESQAQNEKATHLEDDRMMSIVGILEQILNTSVSEKSTLPALGFDSLAAIRFAAELKRKGYPQLDATQILFSRTPVDIASSLHEAESHSVAAQKIDGSDERDGSCLTTQIIQLPTIQPIAQEIDHVLPCTPVQSAMLGETYRDSEMYCNWIELQVDADATSLESALRKLSDHHPLLRSGFVMLSGSEATFALIVWKELSSEQISNVDSLDYDYRIENDRELLRPCSIQLMITGSYIRVLLRIHHALYDQWSIDILRADLSKLLLKEEIVAASSFDLVSAHYEAQRSQAASDQAFDFWHDFLGSSTFSTLPLLTGKKKPPRLASTEWRSMRVSSALVKKTSEDLRCSSPAIFQAALAYLLGSYVGSTEVVFGSVFSGRTIAVSDIDRIFGPCLATLPLRIDVASAHTRRDLLTAITSLNRRVQKHLTSSPSMIKKAAGISPGSPLFDVLFVWQQSSVNIDNAHIVKEVDSADRHEFNLVLEFDPTIDYVRARATYRQSAIAAAQIDVLLQQIESIVIGILDESSKPVTELRETLSPDLLSIANPKPTTATPSHDLVTMLESVAEAHPDMPAIVFADDFDVIEPELTSVSYRQLHARANKIAKALASFNLVPDDVVCICMEKSFDLYAAMLATFKAGVGYLALLPETPSGRVKSILAQSSVKLCLCDSSTTTAYQEHPNTEIWNVSTMDLSHFSESRPQITQLESRIGYVVYTSGSTGEPKGIAIPVSSLHANLAVLTELYRDSHPGDRLLQASSQAFDVSVFEIFFTFYKGMTLCSASKNVLFRDLEHAIRSFKVTHLALTPTVAALVDPANVPDVRLLTTAGEPMNEIVSKKWTGKGLNNGYGPSETTNICSVKMKVTPDDIMHNLGPPFRNTSAFVIAPGKDFQILPAGSYGEFAFGGDQLFRGYIGREDLNSKTIVNHAEFGRIYRSGDLGRMLFDGTLLYCERLDDQIKLRGNRIELGEITAVLLHHHGVRDCATLVFGLGSSDQLIVSFIVPNTSPDGSNAAVVPFEPGLISELFDSVEESLPSYMIPSMVIPIGQLSRTAQGKLDKHSLKIVFDQLSEEERNQFSRLSDQGGDDEPFGPEEESMAQKLSSVLDVPLGSIMRHSSFFALGLNSLNAIQFSKSLESVFVTRVDVTSILRYPSIARLCKFLTDRGSQINTGTAKQRVEAFPTEFIEDIKRTFQSQSRTVEAVLPCTPLQEAMLSISGAASSNAYSNITNIRVNGNLEKLRQCWKKMVRRHTILRTVFIETSISAYPYAQVVVQDGKLPWTTRSRQELTNGLSNHQNGASKVSPSKPFHIEVLDLESNVELTLHMHHAIYDGMSMSNLFAEIEDLYNEKKLGDPVSFEPFLVEVARHNEPKSVHFWSERIKGFRPHPLPYRSDSSPIGEDTISKDLVVPPQHLSSFCEAHSVTALSVYQAAWVKTLSCVQGIMDVCFGNVVSGRTGTVSDVERLIAPCFNTVPLRADLNIVQNNLDLVRHLHQNNIDNLDYQLTALRRIQALSADPSIHLFDSLLLLQPPMQPMNSRLWTIESESGVMDLPLVVELLPEKDTTKLQLHFLSNRIDSTLAQNLAEAFAASLSSCLRYTSSSVTQFLHFDSSKIARKLTPEIRTDDADADGSPNSSTDRSDWSGEEKLIRDVFTQLSQVHQSKISRNTSLYQIGLDSLNAVQVASALRRQGLQIDAADVMQHRTPAGIGSVVSRCKGNESARAERFDFQSFEKEFGRQVLEKSGLDQHAIEAIRPCTSAQKGMLAQSLQTAGRLYVNHLQYRIPEKYNAGLIRDAWMRVQRKHPVLRMGFCQLEDVKHSFVAIVHSLKGSSESRSVVYPNNDTGSEDSSAAQIMQNLSLPVWRVNFRQTANHGRLMRLSIHHAIYDADSLQILLADFALALRSQDIGPVTDIIGPLTSLLRASEHGRQESGTFWSTAIESAGYTKFPNLCPTVVRNGKMDSIHVKSAINISTLDAFCRREGFTIQAIGQSLWAKLLATYTGEPGVTFGTVFSGHNSDASQEVAFPSITTIPVFCDATRSALDVVKSMLSFNASAQKHRFAPLTDIQRYAGRAGQPLFDTVFVYQKSALPLDKRFDWQLESETAAVDYTVSLELDIPSDDHLDLRLTFDTSVMPSSHALIMLEQYDRSLQKLCKPESDDGQLFDGFLSVLPAKYDELSCPVKLLHEFVEIGAQKHPDKPALEFITSFETGKKSIQTWTYRELNEKSNQIAHLLLQAGVQPDGIVAVCMPKCAEASIAFIGILKAGCAFLAMDPDLPAARKNFILEDSKSQLLFVASGSSLKVDADVSIVECRLDDIAGMPITPVDIPTIDPSVTSYCLYTSGTTGTPKGCELTHENAVQAMMSFQRLFSGHWTESSRWLQFASYWFDVSVLEQFWSWSTGITVVGAPRDLVLEDLPDFIKRAKITHIDLTPSLARLLTPDEVPSLCNGVFITGGEALKQEIIDAWGPEKTICNGYGPTEATIGVTMNPFIGTDAKPSNIGPQFDNVGSFVLAPGTDEPVLRGGVGELCVSGKLVGKGYLNRPDQTAKAFPYIERFGKKIYRTGDLVRMLADGSFSFIGRQDTQAKLRGQRLEIDEIDTVIKSSTESISEVASLVTKANDGNREMLVSFITQRGVDRSKLLMESSTSAKEIVHRADQACRDRLPGYMVPTHIISISRLPLTVNNKVDSKSLVAFFQSLTQQDLQGLKGDQNDQREKSPIELKITEALVQLLKISANDVTPSSNIFSVGLSSISAISLTTLLRRAGFGSANVAVIMNNPTVERLAKAISGDRDSQIEQNTTRQAQLSISAFAQRYRSHAAKALSVDISRIEVLAPCTPLQEGLLIESLKSNSRPYFNRFVYETTKKPHLHELEAGLRELVKHVPMLRTRFVRTDDGFAQVVLHYTDLNLRWHTVDERGLHDFSTHAKESWQASSNQEVLHPFDAILARTLSRYFVIFHAHHAIYDGISWDRTMQLFEQAISVGPLDDCGPRFTDALPYGPLCLRPDSKTFWEHRFRGTSYSPLPTLSRRVDSQSPFLRAQLRYSEADDVLRRTLGISHQTIFEASFVAALSHHFSRTQTYGMVVSGRSIGYENAESIIGPMFNTIACAIDVKSSDTWADFLQRCHRASVASLPFQHTPLREVRKFSGRHSTDPMFDVLFVFQRRDKSSSSAYFRELESEVNPDYSLAFEVELLDTGEVNILAVAQPSVATSEMLQTLVDSFKTSFGCIVNTSDLKIEETFDIEERPRHQDAGHRPDGLHQTNGHSETHWTKQGLVIRAAIAQLAGCEANDISQDSTFFTLGLDSIDAVKLGARLKRSGIAIPVSRILQAQTIPKMLDAIPSSQQEETDATSTNRLQELSVQLHTLREQAVLQNIPSVERILPASPGQEALIADMIRSGFREYYNHDVLRLDCRVDLQKLKSAWQRVVDASPILRTSFVEVTDPQIDAIFAQIVHRPSGILLNETTAQCEDNLAQILEEIRKDVVDSFSLRSPLRLTLVNIDSARYLILSLSHAQYDGHSLALLHEDIASAYHGRYEARPSYDSTLDQALNATSPDAVTFWRDSLTDCKISRFRKQREHSTDNNVHRAERRCSITATKARAQCQQLGISMQSLAQTTWAVVLATYSHSLQVTFGVVLACRDSMEAEHVLFPTMNTVPIKASFHGSGHQMLQYVQSSMNEILPYQRTPLRAIQKASSSVVKHNGARDSHGLFDTLFIYQHRPESPKSNNAESLYESVQASSSIEYPVAVELEAVGDAIIIRAACKDFALDQQGTIKLLEQYDHALDALLEHPHEPLINFSRDAVSIGGMPSFQLPTDGAVEKQNGIRDTDSKEENGYVASPVANSIKSALSQISGVPTEDISPSATIESIGIDSISAIKVAALLRKQSIKLSVGQMLMAGTLSKMAKVAEGASTTSVGESASSEEIMKTAMGNLDPRKISKLSDISEDNISFVRPASAGQIYVLSMWQRSEGQIFLPTFRYRLCTKRTIDEVQVAWEKLAAHNPLLRTVFCSSGDGQIPVAQVVLRNTPNSFFTNSANGGWRNITQPMVALLVQSADEGYTLQLKIHHALYDAVSLPLIIRDFNAILNNDSTGASDVTFEDVLAVSSTASSRNSNRAFWKDYLQDIQPLALPQPSQKGAQRKTEIFQPALLSFSNCLEQLARRENVSLQCLLFAAYAKVYLRLIATSSRPESEKDVVLGIYLSNRAHLPALEQLAAPTLNLLPLVVRNPGRRGLLHVAKKIQSDLREVGAKEHSGTALWEIEEWTGVRVDTFVNFLKVPELDHSDDNGDRKEGIVEVDEDRRLERSRVIEAEKQTFAVPRELKGFEVKASYQHSVDVEITVAQGVLDFGFFSPEDMVGLDDAQSAILEFKRLLGELVDAD